jgi:PAS domain S-box-containing protein
MSEFFTKLFDTSDFPARWYCGNWSEFTGWLHILSDIAIWGAYFAIPLVLLVFARKRKDFPFTRLFWLFAGFILACGSVHLVEAIIFWKPYYRIQGVMKLVTAVVSWATVIILLRNMPTILRLPSIVATNDRLREEIRQRRESERDLEALKGRYEALLAGTRSIVWSADANGRFITPQVGWQRYTGQSWEDHQGNGWLQAVHEQDRVDFMTAWDAARGNNHPLLATGRLWHAASDQFRSFVAEAVPVVDKANAVIEWVGTINDVENLKQVESALDVAGSHANRLAAVVENCGDFIGICSPDGKPIYINRAGRGMVGLPPGETIINSHIFDYFADEDQGRLEQEAIPALHREGHWSGEVRFRNIRTGQYTPTRWNMFVVRDPSDENSEVWATVSPDITEHKKLQAALRENERLALAANRSKSEFLANMSHEIRTPMAAILGYADVLLDRMKDAENRDHVGIIKKNGQYLLELINDILDLSRIEANKLEVAVEPFSLSKFIADIQSLVQVRVDEKGLAFEIRFETEVPETLQSDPIRLRQILINLLGNAVKFTDHGRVVLAIKTIVQPGKTPQIEFAVIDEGIGISEEQMQRLFQPFTQGDTLITRNFGGSGLGLAISKRLIDLLGGEIAVESTLGHGSTFRVRFDAPGIEESTMVRPRVDVLPEEESRAEEESRVHLDCRVLVVDDRRDVRRISQLFLERVGATVTTAENGQEGVDAALRAYQAGEAFDVILMDMQMPVVDGLEAVRMLRDAEVEQPVIALTADAMEGDRQRCLRGGCDDYLSKPIEHGALVKMVAYYTQEITVEQLKQQRSMRSRRLRDESDA